MVGNVNKCFAFYVTFAVLIATLCILPVGAEEPQPTVGDWFIIGPFPQNYDESFPPETEIDLAKTYQGKDGVTVAWEKVEGWDDPRAMHDIDAFYAQKYPGQDAMFNETTAYVYTACRPASRTSRLA